LAKQKPFGYEHASTATHFYVRNASPCVWDEYENSHNLSISIREGTEINQDFPSNGE